MTKAAKDRDRALAQSSRNDVPLPDADAEMEEEGGENEAGDTEQEALGSKVIVIHPGSQNLRIGLASDALPKTSPMVVARKWSSNESERFEPIPKRVKTEEEDETDPDNAFGEEVRGDFHGPDPY